MRLNRSIDNYTSEFIIERQIYKKKVISATYCMWRGRKKNEREKSSNLMAVSASKISNNSSADLFARLLSLNHKNITTKMFVFVALSTEPYQAHPLNQSEIKDEKEEQNKKRHSHTHHTARKIALNFIQSIGALNR